jgi:hypothetical protein
MPLVWLFWDWISYWALQQGLKHSTYTRYEERPNKFAHQFLWWNFRSRRWGSSITVCARLTVRSSPHRHEQKFFTAHVCRITCKHLPQPLWSHILSFGPLGQIFKIPPFSAQKSHSAGGRGVPEFFEGWNPNIFFYLGAHAKLQNPTTAPSGRISNEPGERKEEREENAIYSGHLRLCQQPRAAHALRSDQNSQGIWLMVNTGQYK